jgi:hypothetical protein
MMLRIACVSWQVYRVSAEEYPKLVHGELPGPQVALLPQLIAAIGKQML